MSRNNPDDTTTIRPADESSGRGGAGKWLLGGLAALVLIGGGFWAWQSFAPQTGEAETAYTGPDYYQPADEAWREAGPPEQEPRDAEAASAQSAPPAETRTAAAAPRAAPPAQRAAPPAPSAAPLPIPEAIIGVTPAGFAPQPSDDDIVVTARRPVWTATPSERRLSSFYPDFALERGREGEASLSCTVRQGGALDCARVSETPARAGFANAALRVARTLRHAPTFADGSTAEGEHVNLRVIFRIEETPTRRNPLVRS